MNNKVLWCLVSQLSKKNGQAAANVIVTLTVSFCSRQLNTWERRPIDCLWWTTNLQSTVYSIRNQRFLTGWDAYKSGLLLSLVPAVMHHYLWQQSERDVKRNTRWYPLRRQEPARMLTIIKISAHALTFQSPTSCMCTPPTLPYLTSPTPLVSLTYDPVIAMLMMTNVRLV